MTRKKYTECDVCHERIREGGVWARFRRDWKRRWRFKLVQWGIVNYSPVESGWRRKNFDICDDCWPKIVDSAREKVEADTVE